MIFGRKSDYLPVSTTSASSSQSQRTNQRRCVPKRLLKFLLVLVLLVLVAWLFIRFRKLRLPPLYEDFRNREDNLPHYNIYAPYPNGANAKYIFFGNHQKNVGWGNVMQELLLNGLLAYSLKRSFVFYDYEWYSELKYAMYNGHLIPSTIPLSAILSGPLVGGCTYNQDVPIAVSKNYFLQVCPNRTVIRSEELKGQLNDATGLQTLNAWIEKLGAIEDRCIEIPRESQGIFDFFLFGSQKVLDIWPMLSESPIIAQLDWSPLVYSAFKSNHDMFGSRSLSFTSSNTSEAPTPSLLHHHIPGLLVVHIRHGDFMKHCDGLANWSSTFNGFNQFEELPDKFIVPPGGGWGENTPENTAIYREHCYPSIPKIVSKISSVKQAIPGLNRIYIMTNAKKEWINELTRTLQEGSEKWNSIKSTRDLVLTWEEKFISHALDMYIAQQAHSFIGNGWSSLTSNTVLLRMAGKHEPNTTFFW